MSLEIIFLLLLSILMLYDSSINSVKYVKQLSSLLVLSKKRLLVYLYYRVLKNNWLQLVIVLCVSIIGISQWHLYYGVAISFLLLIIFLPYLNLSLSKLWIVSGMSSAVCFLIVAYQWIWWLNFLLLPLGIFLIKHTTIFLFKKDHIISKVFEKYRSFFTVLQFLLCYLAVYLSNHWQYIPIEQSIALVSVLFVAFIESTYKQSAKILNRFRAKYFINLVKKNKVNLLFLSEKQKNDFKKNYVIYISLIVLTCLLTTRLEDFIVLLLGSFAVICLTVDIIVNHYILQKSVVYRNNVVRELLTFLLSSLFFTYFVFITIDKLIERETVQKFEQFKYYYTNLGAIVFIIISIFCFYRHIENYKLPKSNMTDGEG